MFFATRTCTFLSIVFVCFCVNPGFVVGGETTPQNPSWIEQNVDRPGSDFQILWLRGGPEGCQAACAQHPLCRSYTYVRSQVPGRPEGCWLKNGIPPPVADGCCVSGVKTEEAFARILRETPVLSTEVAIPDRAPDPSIVLAAPHEENGGDKERVLGTDAGIRIASTLRFAAIPPGSARTAESGAGRTMATGMDFAAVPPSASSPDAAPLAGAKFRHTGNGLRKIAGVRYTATPPSGTRLTLDVSPGAATRTVSGADMAAVPPQR